MLGNKKDKEKNEEVLLHRYNKLKNISLSFPGALSSSRTRKLHMNDGAAFTLKQIPAAPKQFIFDDDDSVDDDDDPLLLLPLLFFYFFALLHFHLGKQLEYKRRRRRAMKQQLKENQDDALTAHLRDRHLLPPRVFLLLFFYSRLFVA